LACQLAGIKTKCIAHAFLAGDIKDEPKTNCLPVLADKLYVWSQESYDSLKGYEEMEKIRMGGYPKFSKEYIKEKKKKYLQKRIVTFFSGYQNDKEWVEEDSRLRKELFKLLKEISARKGYKIYIRYFPKDEIRIRKNERPLLKKYHIKISKNSFIKDVLQSKMILSIWPSSSLYEAKIMGRKAFLLRSKYDKMFFMENFEYIDVNDIEKKLREKTDNESRYDLLMDLDFVVNDL